MQENIPAGVEPQSPLPAMAAAGGQGSMPHRGGSSPVVNGTSPGSKSPSVLLPVAPPDPSLLGGRSQDFVKLFVGSVPRNATEDELRDLFGEFGTLLEVAVIKNKATGLSQGCAFVKYASIEDAERAIRAVNNMRCLPGNTVPVQVRFADGERERLGAIEHKLFVGSVSRHSGEAEVKELFCQYGHVEDVYIMRDENKQSKGCCFVKYSNRESAMNAINALNGLYTMEGSDQPLAVRFADPKKPKGTMEMQGFGGPGFRPRGGPFMSRGGMQGGRGMGSMDGGRPHMWRGPMGGPGIGHMGPGGPMGPRMMAGPMGGLAGPMGGQGGQMGGPGPMGGAGPLGHHGPMGAPTMLHPGQSQQQPQQPGMQQPMPLMMGGPGAGVMPLMQQQQQAQGYYQPPPQQAVDPQQQPQPQQQMPQHMQQQMPQGIQQQMPQQMQQQTPLQQQPVAPPQQYIPPTCDWSEHTAPEGYKYYYNSATGVSQWEKPPELTAYEQAQQQVSVQHQMPPQQQHQQTPQQQGMPIVQQYPGAQMLGQPMQYGQQHQGGMQGMEARPNQIQGPPGANLFVFRIPDDFTDENLTQTFTPFGNVISARVGVEKESGRNRGFGFVSFDNAASAEKAIQQLNGVTIGGRRLKVERKRGEENGSVGYRPY
ncbi:hypothetical protein CBR_g38484 [Chara braunii]|uniref:Uncharacterized protein n=1 Tax=Chara braunii TaxID=69332 RepID=A0A388JNQ8_CHABU|nr:hypothetical protein CBR_g38484 [Chara braunii]|eukprot:GBG59460.1 hypothetical protein CBR_g38484 [Chara braunii]